MADKAGKTTLIFVDGNDITGYFRGVERSKAIGAIDTTVFGLNSQRFVAGLKSGQFTLDGFYDDSDLPATPWPLENILGTAKVVSVITDNAVNARGDSGDVKQVDYGISEAVDGVAAVSSTFRINGPPYFMPVLDAKTTRTTGTGNGTQRDDTASSAFGAVGAVHVGGVAGTPGSIAVKIQDSPNGSSWADLITFANIVTTAGGGEVKRSALRTVDRYLRIVWTVTTFTTCWILVLCGRLKSGE